ncbi:peroxidase 28-like [Senna tora]|uniref:peroxidase n=1 Tax=Senna tora TaxID=362788 RepID=A0A834T856_9FABA|nr:peroxidase 28-like [Senna tora]
MRLDLLVIQCNAGRNTCCQYGSPQPKLNNKLGGRRDNFSSRVAKAEDNLPFPNWSMDQMLNLFQKKGFNAEDMVALNGTHSVGSAHCNIFSERLYNYSNTGRPDPSLDPVAVDELKKILEKRKALLETDQAMANDKRTASFVKRMAEDPNLFPIKFGKVNNRMGSLGVQTGKQGEVHDTDRVRVSRRSEVSEARQTTYKEKMHPTLSHYNRLKSTVVRILHDAKCSNAP